MMSTFVLTEPWWYDVARGALACFGLWELGLCRRGDAAHAIHHSCARRSEVLFTGGSPELHKLFMSGFRQSTPRGCRKRHVLVDAQTGVDGHPPWAPASPIFISLHRASLSTCRAKRGSGCA